MKRAVVGVGVYDVMQVLFGYICVMSNEPDVSLGVWGWRGVRSFGKAFGVEYSYIHMIHYLVS